MHQTFLVGIVDGIYLFSGLALGAVRVRITVDLKLETV